MGQTSTIRLRWRLLFVLGTWFFVAVLFQLVPGDGYPVRFDERLFLFCITPLLTAVGVAHLFHGRDGIALLSAFAILAVNSFLVGLEQRLVVTVLGLVHVIFLVVGVVGVLSIPVDTGP